MIFKIETTGRIEVTARFERQRLFKSRAAAAKREKVGGTERDREARAKRKPASARTRAFQTPAVCVLCRVCVLKASQREKEKNSAQRWVRNSRAMGLLVFSLLST